jgi:hypothetical protein
MNPAINDLVRSVLHKDSLSQCSVSELEKLVTQYPYFAPAQFLLAQKLKAENSPRYTQQSQRALLYFQDQLWFDYLSRDEEIAGNIIDQREDSNGSSSPIQSNEIGEANPPEVLENLTKDLPIAPLAPDLIQTGIPEAETPPPDLLPESPSSPVAPLISDSLSAPPQEDSDLPIEEENEPLLPPLPALKIEPISEKTLTFEPFHTVDYFASQGIRMKEEEKPKDRFTQQLRSFTEWLKTMKRLPESELVIPQATSIDPQVTSMAEHSLVDREVVTEAMAEVWEKQGNPLKAIEVYNKLSLLDPSKSAYFAARIQQLKTQ